jgi:hypothetical protein
MNVFPELKNQATTAEIPGHLRLQRLLSWRLQSPAIRGERRQPLPSCRNGPQLMLLSRFISAYLSSLSSNLRSFSTVGEELTTRFAVSRFGRERKGRWGLSRAH